jgi:hypothetical protein
MVAGIVRDLFEAVGVQKRQTGGRSQEFDIQFNIMYLLRF